MDGGAGGAGGRGPGGQQLRKPGEKTTSGWRCAIL